MKVTIYHRGIDDPKLEQVIIKYPDPRFTKWYLTKFPKITFEMVEIVLIAVGFTMTATGNKKLIEIPTFAFLGLLLIGAAIHVWAWILKRMVERKRAKYLDISLHEYWNLFE
jgi:hypothetical protein